jgi:glycosyltransferase involved in cell wall biosynthesis
VVAFPLSCDGIDAVDGYNALIAGSREEFADKIVKVLSDPMQSDKLAKNGRKTVEKSYSWISKSKMLEEVFSKVLNM